MTYDQELAAWNREQESERQKMLAKSRSLYRDNPAYRLNAINRMRRKRGLPTIADLSESQALRI